MTRNAVVLVLLLLAAPWMPLTDLSLDGSSATPAGVWTGTSATFVDGSTEHVASLGPGLSGYVQYATVPGAGLAEGSVDVSLTPSEVAEQQTYSLATGGLSGIAANTSVTANGLVLTTTLGGPPQSGNTSQQVSTAVQWTGTKSFDVLHLVCNGSVCGAVTGTNLTIVAREIILESGTSISVAGAMSSGTGAGTSTTTPGNGRSDGAGGGGHGGAGGAGGGSNGGSGGSTYGNGTEAGSPGGDVTGNSYYNDAYGGNGGGLLTLRAGSIIVNGTLNANGYDGDAGVNPIGGTGAGGSGAGGGSGGSIDIVANTLSVSGIGSITANGGDGGDGKDGQQSGAGVMMYDGGDGGGGGGGGYVSISTTVGGYASQGTVTANAGGGGAKGLKYGTGIDGVDGSSGSAGTVSTSTWSGYATGSFAASNGVYQADAIAFPSVRGPLWMNHSATVPTDATLEVMARTSMSPPGTASPAWSNWTIVPLSNASLGRATFLQVAYAMTRTGTASPSVMGFDLDGTRWTTVDSLSFSLASHTVPTPSDMTLTTSSASLDLGNAALTFSLPDDADPVGDGRMWFGWTPTDAALMVEHSTLGVLMDVDTDVGVGHDLVLSHADLTSMLNTATVRTATDGRVWRDVTLDLASTTALGDLGLSVGHVAVPWSMDGTLDLAAATNASIIDACSSIYLSTTCGTLSTHDLTYTAGPTTDSDVTLVVRDPSLTWVDDEPPRLSRVLHRYGGIDSPTVRLGEQTAVVVEDLIDESTATVDLWLATTVGDEAARTTASWNGAMGGWVAVLNTADHMEAPGSLPVSVRMTDDRGNVAVEDNAYAFTVLDSMPEVATFTVVSNDATSLLEGDVLNGVWEGESPEFSLEFTDAGGRSDLDASVHVERGGIVSSIPAPWNTMREAYVATWTPGRADHGTWTLEVVVDEPDAPFASDEDGLQVGPDAVVVLVDRTAPTNLTIDAPQNLMLGADLDLSGSWRLSPDESVSATLALLDARGATVAQTGVGPGPVNTVDLSVSAEQLAEGVYTAILEVLDADGNAATPVEASVTVDQPVGVFGNVGVLFDGPTGLNVTWSFLSDLPAANLSVLVDGVVVESMAIDEGDGRLALDVLTAASTPLAAGATSAVLDVEVCHLQDGTCLTNRTVLDLAPLQDLGLSGTCVSMTPDGNGSDLLVCQIANNGLLPVHLSWRTTVDGVDDGWTLTLQPGAERTLWESNPAFTRWNEADRATMAWSVAWTLTASHEVGPSTMIQNGAYSFTPPKVEDGSNNDGSETQGDGASGSNEAVWIGVAALVLVAAAAGGAVVLRRAGPSEEKVTVWSEPTHEEAAMTEDDAVPEQALAVDPEAAAYHAGLLEQGYTPDDALAYTRQYFPDFRV